MFLLIHHLFQPKMSLSDEKGTNRLLKKQPFYNVPIENPKIKHLNNIDMLSELPFYDELNNELKSVLTLNKPIA